MENVRLRKPKEFTIDRETWMTSFTNNILGDDSYLLDKETGRKCCLGFYALACGVNREAIVGRDSPEKINGYQLPWLVRDGKDTQIANELIAINDLESDHKKREKQIKDKFKLIGIKVNFVGRYPTVKQLEKEGKEREETFGNG